MNNLLKLAKVSASFQKRNLISSTIRMSSYLIQDPKYSFLKDLGLAEKNPGVFATHGQWFGDGEVIPPQNKNLLSSFFVKNLKNTFQNRQSIPSARPITNQSLPLFK
jgi:hypothetical protein